MKKHILGSGILAALLLVPLSVGAAESLPAVLQARHGRPIAVRESQAAGKHVVLVFWQSWCAPCKREAPKLVKASHRLKDKALFIGVVSGSDDSIDERKVDRFIQSTGLDYPQVRDRDLRLTRGFEVKGTPTIIVIDPAGRMTYRGHHAPEDWSRVLGA